MIYFWLSGGWQNEPEGQEIIQSRFVKSCLGLLPHCISQIWFFLLVPLFTFIDKTGTSQLVIYPVVNTYFREKLFPLLGGRHLNHSIPSKIILTCLRNSQPMLYVDEIYVSINIHLNLLFKMNIKIAKVTNKFDPN